MVKGFVMKLRSSDMLVALTACRMKGSAEGAKCRFLYLLLQSLCK